MFIEPWILSLASVAPPSEAQAALSFWSYLLDILILLSAAMVLGALFERFKQSAIVGYLLAGTLLGPHALNAIHNETGVRALAELGVALLLLSIGLEFSWRRLRRLGVTALLGGALQIGVTILVATAVGVLTGLSPAAATAVGAILALSSTAVVLRTLSDRAEVDSIHGRAALGVLLVQDIAVVPLVLLVEALGGKGTALEAIEGVGEEAVLAVVMVACFVLISRYALPRVIAHPAISKNRELPILFAIVVALGSAWAAYKLGLSPALGAFVAGVIVGGSPLAAQIRSDVGPLKTLFVTLFFGAIGMLADLGWIIHHAGLVIGVIVAVVVGKGVVVWAVERAFHRSHRHALATGLSLAQVGEFSFVLAGVAWAGGGGRGVIDDDLFALMISVTIGTLFLTPYLAGYAVPISGWIERGLRRAGVTTRPTIEDANPSDGVPRQGHVVIIGFGPAGQAVADALRRGAAEGEAESESEAEGVVEEARQVAALKDEPPSTVHISRSTPSAPPRVAVIDLNPRTVLAARSRGVWALAGDASSAEIIEAAHIHSARAVVVTLPYYRAAMEAIEQIRAACPGVPIIARARYHIHAGVLFMAGAQAVVDEETNVGERLGVEVMKVV